MKFFKQSQLIRFTYTILLFLSCCHPNKQYEFTDIDKLVSFSKVYGYVKYFYPSDEAAALDWDAFAIYGASRVRKAKDGAELKDILNEIFSPIAPELEITDGEFKDQGPLSHARGTDTIAWQHQGNGFGNVLGYYKSVRTGRKSDIRPNRGDMFAFLSIDPEQLRGKTVKWECKIKVEPKTASSFAIAWVNLRSDNLGYQYPGRMEIFGNRQWKKYESEVFVPKETLAFSLDLGLFGLGRVDYDSVRVSIQEHGKWRTVYKENFDSIEESERPGNVSAYTGGYSSFGGKELYECKVLNDSVKANKCLVIKSKEVIGSLDSLFAEVPTAGEMLKKDIGNGLKIRMPLMLIGDSLHTYPVVPDSAYQNLNSILDQYRFDEADLDARQGDIINAWNVFQHFYPYFKYLNIDWEAELKKSLTRTYSDQTPYDFLNTIKLLLSKLQDGHSNVVRYGPNDKRFYPPVEFEYLQGKIIVNQVFYRYFKYQEG